MMQKQTAKKNQNEVKNEPKVILKEITKVYQRGKVKVTAINKLSAEFFPGEISLIIGPSGCGKTTLLKSIAGMIEISAGSIEVYGRLIQEMNEKELDIYRAKELGYVFQFFNLIPELTVRDNIELPLEIANFPKNQRQKRVEELLKIIELENRQNHYPDELSGGQQQKVAIAMALANNPRLILCDEPTGELDSSSKKKIMQLLHSIIQKFPEKTIIIVSHDNEMRYLADRIFHIRDGMISYIEVLKDYEKQKLHEFLLGNISISETQDEIETEIKETIYFLSEKLKKIKK
ncbi:MAG: ATP-binding cassette domain-containing protein [Promethearchaeota archaeon]